MLMSLAIIISRRLAYLVVGEVFHCVAKHSSLSVRSLLLGGIEDAAGRGGPRPWRGGDLSYQSAWEQDSGRAWSRLLCLRGPPGRCSRTAYGGVRVTSETGTAAGSASCSRARRPGWSGGRRAVGEVVTQCAGRWSQQCILLDGSWGETGTEVAVKDDSECLA